ARAAEGWAIALGASPRNGWGELGRCPPSRAGAVSGGRGRERRSYTPPSWPRRPVRVVYPGGPGRRRDRNGQRLAARPLVIAAPAVFVLHGSPSTTAPPSSRLQDQG